MDVFECPKNDDGYDGRDGHADKRREYYERGDFEYHADVNRVEARPAYCGARESAYERVRRRRRNSEPPSEKIPENRREYARKYYRHCHILFYDDLGHGVCYAEFPDDVLRHKEREEVERGGP